MPARPRKSSPKPQPPRHEDADLVLREFRALVVQNTRIEAAVERPGTEDEMVSYRVYADMGGREAELLVRILPEQGSYACWTVQKQNESRFAMLNTFDAYQV
jgi:hypothetical protein